MHGRTGRLIHATALGLAVIAFGAQGAAADEGERETGRGKQLYMAHCAACHGANGEGSGPVAPFLTVSPVNLAQIAARNGGSFPFLEIYKVIDGRTRVGAHGESQMPVWGSAFKAELGQDYGPYGEETFVRARVTSLTFYIQSIQK